MFMRRRYVVMDAASDGSSGAAAGGGGGADGGAAGAPAAGTDAAAGGGGAAAGGAPTALAAGGGSAAAAAGGGAPPAGTATGTTAPEPVPDKFRVAGADGQTDWQATALKLATEGYRPLEKRLGSGDVPPQSVDGYKVNIPEALKDKVDAAALAGSDAFKDFLGKAHAAGLSQKQLDVVAGELLTRGLALRKAGPALQAADCEATLRQADGWKTDAEYSAQIRTAFTAATKIFGKDAEEMVNTYGNDARFVRGMAAIGREMAEDAGPSPEAQAAIAGELDQLVASAAYLNPNDPQHAATVAKVTALTAKAAGTRPVIGRSFTFKT